MASNTSYNCVILLITYIKLELELILAYSSSFNVTPPIFRVLIFFAYPRDQRAVTRLENVRHLNIRRGKKEGFRLSHTQPLRISICFQFENFNRLISMKQFVSIY